MTKLSIVLPCYNPPVQWAANIVAHYTRLVTLIGKPIELVIVEDGKSNNISLADKELLNGSIPGLIYHSYPENRGKGYALRMGVKQATGDVVIYTDIDFPYVIDNVHQIFTLLNNDECDVCVGVKDGKYYDQVVTSRRIISKFLRWLIRTFLSVPITDTQCGLKGFKQNVKPLFLQTTIDRYLFDLEFIRNSFKKGYKITAVPVTLKEDIFIRRINYRVLIPEVINFTKLLFKKI